MKKIITTSLLTVVAVLANLGPVQKASAQSGNLSYDSESALYSAFLGLTVSQPGTPANMTFTQAGNSIYSAMSSLSLLETTDTKTLISAYKQSRQEFLNAAFRVFLDYYDDVVNEKGNFNLSQSLDLAWCYQFSVKAADDCQQIITELGG